MYGYVCDICHTDKGHWTSADSEVIRSDCAAAVHADLEVHCPRVTKVNGLYIHVCLCLPINIYHEWFGGYSRISMRRSSTNSTYQDKGE